MRQFLTKICLSSSVFFMASCGMFGGDEEETVEEAPVVAAAEETAETEETTEVVESEPIILEDEVETGEKGTIRTLNICKKLVNIFGEVYRLEIKNALTEKVLQEVEEYSLK